MDLHKSRQNPDLVDPWTTVHQERRETLKRLCSRFNILRDLGMNRAN